MFGEPDKLKKALAAYVTQLEADRNAPSIDPGPAALEQRIKNIEDFLLSMHDAGF